MQKPAAQSAHHVSPLKFPRAMAEQVYRSINPLAQMVKKGADRREGAGVGVVSVSVGLMGRSFVAFCPGLLGH